MGDDPGEIYSPSSGREPERLNAGNYRIRVEDGVGKGSLKQKCRDNFAAIELVQKLDGEGRVATDEEKRVLVKYVGWGGIPQVFAWHEAPDWQPERERLKARQVFQAEETGYQQIQGTKPQTIGIALNDSPAGLAAWIVEKFRTWCDCDGNPETVFTKDELLTNITLYWVTQTAASSARIYYESRHAPPSANASRRIEVPTACADFPKEIIWSPRRWLEPRYNITRWTEMPKGGHFAAFEQPQLLIDDVRAFFRGVR